MEKKRHYRIPPAPSLQKDLGLYCSLVNNRPSYSTAPLHPTAGQLTNAVLQAIVPLWCVHVNVILTFMDMDLAYSS